MLSSDKKVPMRYPIAIFGIVTILPALLLASGTIWGGGWIWFALAYMTAISYTLDEALAPLLKGCDDAAVLRAADALSVTLAICHFGLLALAVWGLTGGAYLTGYEKIGLFFAFGLYFGQVSNSNAHELIHRGDKMLFQLGKWVYISLLFGHHTSAHRLIHHVYVGSDQDPNTARSGESFYRFAFRAWIGSFREGRRAETVRRTQQPGLHPYIEYGAGAVLICAIAFLIGQWGGVVTLIALATYAQMQLLMSDYVQHYGLERKVLDNGKLEPVDDSHSWNAPHWFSSLMMLNAPRHSEHHAHPARPYPALQPVELQDIPTLPRSLPIMAAIALVPSYWRKLMDPRVQLWNKKG